MATGLYPHQHRVIGNDPVFDPGGKETYGKDWLKQRAVNNQSVVDGIQELSTIADLLADAGYVSLQTGKWWEGHYSVGGFSQGMTHGDPSRGGRHGDEGLKIGREGLDVIYDFIDDAQGTDTPFFVWYAPFLPHAPHTPPDSLRDKYLPLAPTPAVANYWAMCEWFDITCGQLMDYIEEKELAENTLFVYVTDNGWIQDPDRPNRYAPRSKRAPYDMGIRTPIMYRWKGVIEPEMDKTSLSSSIDIATTILDICGIEPTEAMQGINVLDKETRKAREAVFAEVYAHDFSTVDSSLYHRIIITRPWKLILTDRAYDPSGVLSYTTWIRIPMSGRTRPRTHPEIVARLSGQLEGWWNQ